MTVSLELLGRGPSRPDLLEDLVLDEASAAEVLRRWSVRTPVVVRSDPATGLPALDEVMEALAGGTPAVVDVQRGLAAIAAMAAGGPTSPDPGQTPAAAAGPDRSQSAAHFADLLAVAAHSGVGFGSGLVPRCTDASQVWALLSGAVAAMTGGDVRAAVAAPDREKIVGLSRSAREAIRDVVTCVLVPGDQLEAVRSALAPVDDD